MVLSALSVDSSVVDEAVVVVILVIAIGDAAVMVELAVVVSVVSAGVILVA